jgi:4-hydroxybenzoate polyprenyltransferase
VNLRTALRLGRVSNLPTVWTNALAGAVLAGGAGGDTVLAAAVALSLFYVGGMWLNDAFDAEIDARERAGRPIPQGDVDRGTVFAGGSAFLGAGVVAGFVLGPRAGAVALALAAAIVAYDWLHKSSASGPVIMGAVRFLAYGFGGAVAGGFTLPLVLGGVGLLAHVVGLTYAARQEAYDRIDRGWPLAVLAVPLVYSLLRAAAAPPALLFWLALAVVTAVALRFLFRRSRGDVPRAVVTLIAAISLYDATLIAAAGHFGLGLLAALGFALTLALQRLVSGT